MDNITPLVLGTKTHCTITLSEYQLAYYRQSCIELLAPDGTHLETIGEDIKKDQRHQLREEICLVECLLSQINHNVDMPPQALSSLADLLYRMRDDFENSIGV
jgi:hypothetical protein